MIWSKINNVLARESSEELGGNIGEYVLESLVPKSYQHFVCIGAIRYFANAPLG